MLRPNCDRQAPALVVVQGVSCPTACGILVPPTRDGTHGPLIGRQPGKSLYGFLKLIHSISFVINTLDIHLTPSET